MNLYRHGDISFTPVEKAEGKEIVASNKYIVAYGEVTGHTHTLTTRSKSGIRVFQNEKGERFIDITGKASLKHQEHNELQIEQGIYKVGLEREYDYFGEMMKTVVD